MYMVDRSIIRYTMPGTLQNKIQSDMPSTLINAIGFRCWSLTNSLCILHRFSKDGIFSQTKRWIWMLQICYRNNNLQSRHMFLGKTRCDRWNALRSYPCTLQGHPAMKKIYKLSILPPWPWACGKFHLLFPAAVFHQSWFVHGSLWVESGIRWTTWIAPCWLSWFSSKTDFKDSKWGYMDDRSVH